MVEKTVLSDLEGDLQELSSLYAQATRIHVKTLLEKELTKLKDIILIERNKIVQKTEESKDQKLNEFLQTENVVYTAIKNYSWEQEGKNVKVYLSLDGVGDVEKENISCEFEEEGFDLKIKGFKNQNLRFAVKRLNATIDKEHCKFIIKKNSIHLTLTKKESKTWDNLYYKENADEIKMKFDKQEEAPKKEDPQESMMNMMKKLYQEGDDEMKKTIAQAWTKSQDEKEKKGFK